MEVATKIEIEVEPEEESTMEIQKYLDEFSEKIQDDNSNETPAAEEGDDDEVGTFFVDEDGQLYFQPAAEEAAEAEPEKAAEPAAEEEDISYVYIVEEGEDKNENKEENDITVYDFDEDNDEASQAADESVEVEVKKPIRKSKNLHHCPHCDYSNVKRTMVNHHMKIHSDGKPYKCFVCGRGFRTVTSLTNHENTHTGNKPFRCRLCDARFTTSGEIVRHVRYRHSNFRPHKCNECNYAAVELSKLRRHQRSHTGERPYQCPHCTYASPDTFKLKRHIRVHTGERPYKCDICSAAFSQSNSLKTHRLTHFPEQRPVYQCALCPVTCGRKADLRGHISKLHTPYKPYECKRCGKVLPDRYSYKMHIRTHNGERSYKCNICSYASVSKLHLESHMYIHTDEKPYKCDMCDYRSRQKQLLKRHKNFYHTPGFIPPSQNVGTHECEACHKKFIHIGNLIKHLAVHDPESNVHSEKQMLKMGRKRRVKQERESSGMPNVTLVDNFAEDDEHYVIYEMVGDDEGNQEMEEEEEEPAETKPATRISKARKQDNDESDMKNCFGFTDEEDEGDKSE